MGSPRSVFNWKIEVDGVDQLEMQTCQLPEMGVEVVKHGGTNYDIKTAGRFVQGDITIEKLKSLLNTSTWATDWLAQCQDPFLGGGLLPSVYKRDIVIKEMDTTGTVTLSKYVCEGCFPTKVTGPKLDRLSSDNIIETVILSVDRVKHIGGGVGA